MNGHYISVNNNLLETKHFKAMKMALWVYLWCLDKQTDNRNGVVLGGKSISIEEIKKDINIPRATIYRYLTQLEFTKYITIHRKKSGMIITITKAKKVFGIQNLKNETQNLKNETQNLKNETQNLKNETPFHYIDNTIDNTIYKSGTQESSLKENSSLEKAPAKTQIKPEVTKRLAELMTTVDNIFGHWNASNIIVHRVLEDKYIKRIKSKLREGYTLDQILHSISNYGEILKSNDYYWTHKWTLDEFLQRGLDKFMDLEIARKNYRKEGPQKGVVHL